MKDTQNEEPKALTAEELYSELLDLKDDIVDLELQFSRQKLNLEAEITILQSKLNDYEREIETLKSKIDDHEYEIEEAKSISNDAMNISEECQAEVFTFQEKIDQIASDVSEVLILKT